MAKRDADSGRKPKFNVVIFAVIIAAAIFAFLFFYGESLGYTARFYYVGTTPIPAPPEYVDRQIALNPNMPNLIPAGVSMERDGANYVYTVNVRNDGGVTAGQFTVLLRDIDPLSKLGDDIGTCTIWYVNPDVTDFCKITSPVQAKLIEVIVDSTNTITEGDESDNIATF